MIRHGLQGVVIYVVFFAVLVLLGAASYLALLKFAEKRYREIEN